jgi:hypothetical protein
VSEELFIAPVAPPLNRDAVISLGELDDIFKAWMASAAEQAFTLNKQKHKEAGLRMAIMRVNLARLFNEIVSRVK